MKANDLSAHAVDSPAVLAVRVALYTRVSTADQNGQLQLRELHDYAVRQGWQVVETYQDVMSGSKAQRPGLNRLMADAETGKSRCLLVWKLDRFGRSLVDYLSFVDAFRTFCLEPGVQGKSILLGLPQLTPLFSPISTGPEAMYGR